MNIAQGLAHATKVHGNRPAICCGAIRCTWQEFDRRIDSLARGLASLGVGRGDRVAVLMLNCHRYLELYYACARMGAVIVPVNIRLALPEIAFILNDSEATLLLVDQTFASVASQRDRFPGVLQIIYTGPGTSEAPAGLLHYEHLVQQGTTIHTSADQAVGEDELYGLFYTGGTTGRAKGVMLSHRNITSKAMHIIMACGLTLHEVYLHASPMFHLSDLGGTFANTMMGACHVFLPQFHPVEVLRLIQTERVTMTILAPTMVNALLNHPESEHADVSSLRTLLYGAAPMPVELLRKGLKQWGQIFIQGYGMTETAPAMAMLLKSDHIVDGTPEEVHRLSSCGKQVLGVEVRVINPSGEDVQPGEVGEIIARGDNVMLGYWHLPEVTAEVLKDGWMHTGDLATIDEEQYIYILDRARDMIISGGENVYSVEVENALYTHPAVLEVAVFGIPHDQWGEAIHAVVVCKPGLQVSREDLIVHARSQIAGYKVPRSIEFYTEALPKSGAGKILKRDPYWVGKRRRVN
jgi:long-chain acyl-CoA synthetase